MQMSATDFSKDTEAVLDLVLKRGESVEIQQSGKTVAELRPKAGVTREELLRILSGIRWTEAESRQLREAMDAATEIFGYAGRD
jgi:antitoxin (DNA-binding transcriptional repressor) of toxin-antitoxin stability system